MDWIWTQTFWSVGTAFVRFTAEGVVPHLKPNLFSNRKYILQYWVT